MCDDLFGLLPCGGDVSIAISRHSRRLTVPHARFLQVSLNEGRLTQRGQSPISVGGGIPLGLQRRQALTMHASRHVASLVSIATHEREECHVDAGPGPFRDAVGVQVGFVRRRQLKLLLFGHSRLEPERFVGSGKIGQSLFVAISGVTQRAEHLIGFAGRSGSPNSGPATASAADRQASVPIPR